eukprot:20780-Amphidinium_carterae.1
MHPPTHASSLTPFKLPAGASQSYELIYRKNQELIFEPNVTYPTTLVKGINQRAHQRRSNSHKSLAVRYSRPNNGKHLTPLAATQCSEPNQHCSQLLKQAAISNTESLTSL